MPEVVDVSEVADKLKLACSFDLLDIRDRFLEDNPNADVSLVEREFLRWVALVAHLPNRTFPMGGVVDQYWHTFLLFTKEYHRFCDIVAGRFIHHIPETNRSRSVRDLSTEAKIISNFISTYELAYGEMLPQKVWPFRTFAIVYDPGALTD